MKRLLVLASVLSAMLASSVPADATHSWGTFHWSRAANPVSLTVVDSVVGEWDGYLGPVVADWDASTVLALSSAAGADLFKDRKRCTAILGKIRACNASYGFNGWLGLAQIWLYSGTSHIAQGVAKVNDSYFNTSTYNNPSAKRHVLCQEIGHDFGLNHQYTQPSCMDDTNGLFDPAYVSPGSHDYEQIETIYNGHFDSASAAPSGPGNSSGARNGASSRSTVEVSRDGDFDLITVTLWAD